MPHPAVISAENESRTQNQNFPIHGRFQSSGAASKQSKAKRIRSVLMISPPTQGSRFARHSRFAPPIAHNRHGDASTQADSEVTGRGGARKATCLTTFRASASFRRGCCACPAPAGPSLSSPAAAALPSSSPPWWCCWCRGW